MNFLQRSDTPHHLLAGRLTGIQAQYSLLREDAGAPSQTFEENPGIKHICQKIYILACDSYIQCVHRFRVLSSSGSRDFDVQTTHQRSDLKANLWYVQVV